MNKITGSALIAVATLALGVAPATADDGDDGEIELLTEETAAITAGDTAWLALNWTAEDGDISDVAVVLRKDPGKGVEVSYPTNTGTWTGLMDGHQLAEGEIDFTALRVFVPADFDKKEIKLELEVSYTAGGEKETDKVKVDVPVVHYTDGEHVVQHESSVEMASGASVWVDVDLTGLAPVVDDVRMTASSALVIVYPDNGDATSPHGDSRLEDGETDTARFRVDSEDAAPGVYTVNTELSYEFAGERYTRPGTVTVTITG